MNQIHSTIACNLDSNILLTALPLFEAERVQAIEWSFDTLFAAEQIPAWFLELLHAFSAGKRLLGHGVFFSLFSGKWTKAQEDWLKELRALSHQFQFQHITEHFGFMTGESFHKGAPISVPFSPEVLALGQDRLKRIADACSCPVGLENLAIAYSLEEVKKQGAFLDSLLEAVNGFLILDLHNLYCQIHNFQINFEDLIQYYALDKVREIHISGGSWEENRISPEQQIRRDTHDNKVPNAVFELLKKTIPRCPNLQFVVLEQLGTALTNAQSQQQFQSDFYQMDAIIQIQNKQLHRPDFINNFMPSLPFQLGEALENLPLHRQQLELSQILETATDYPNAKQRLQSSSLANTAWKIETWDNAMLDTVIQIAQKWK